jgi:hypothetical protein
MCAESQINRYMPNPLRTGAPHFPWVILTVCLALNHFAQAEDPVITVQPTNQTVSFGGTATFKVTATSTNTGLTCQWQRNDLSVPGTFTNLDNCTARQFTLYNVAAGQAGDYRAVVANSVGNSVTSQVARLILVPVAFTVQPIGQTASPGGDVQFRSMATSTNTPVTYQWQHAAFNLPDGFTNIPSAINSLLSLANVVGGQAGDYRVIASNAGGDSVTSLVARLVVDPTFLRVNEGPGGADAAGSVGAAWGDANGDGYPDLFIANSSGTPIAKNAFWLNNKDGTFTKVTTGRPILDMGAWWYALWVDFDNDGDLDLHVLAAGGGADKFYRNDGNGVFTPVVPEFVKTVSDGGLCDWSDFNNVPFDARGIIQLRYARTGSNWERVPQTIDQIPVRQRCGRLHAVIGSIGGAPEGQAIGALVLHYADGT